MREAPVGLIGAFIAERPYLSMSVIASGLAALAIVGARQAGAGALIADLGAVSAGALIAPMALAAATPRKVLGRIAFIALVFLFGIVLMILDQGGFGLSAPIATPPADVIGVSLGFYAFLTLAAPLAGNIALLGVLAAFGAVLGVSGASGFLALEGFLSADIAGPIIVLGLTIGVNAGIHAGAAFVTFFTEGEGRGRAAAAAGHFAVAPSALSLLMLFAFLVIYMLIIGDGQPDWRLLRAGFVVACFAVLTSLVAVIGGLVLSDVNERIALDENRRRQWFAKRWQPIRLALPASTASAAVLIAGIFVVIAAFEVGIAAPFFFAVFIAFLFLVACLTLVSIRTAALLAVNVAVSALLADFALNIFGAPQVLQEDKFAGLVLAVMAVSSLMVSWRDAGEQWRNARDVVEHALSDGLRRYLFVLGAGAASYFAAMRVLEWSGAMPGLVYFLTVSLIALILSPAAMTAMSARFRG